MRKDYIIAALIWLNRHHTGYKDITIVDENFGWMGDENIVNIVSESEVSNILSQKDDDLEEEGDKYVSSAHIGNTKGDLMQSTIQTNDKREILTKEQSKPVIELEEISKSTKREHKIINIPPIDREDPIS